MNLKKTASSIILTAACLIAAGSAGYGSAATSAGQTALTIVYPPQDAQLPAVSRSFAFGAAPAGAEVSVNGVRAYVAPSGGWIAYLPFSSGKFTLHVSASSGRQLFSADRSVNVGLPAATTPATPAQVDTIVAPAPQSDVVLEPGDRLRLFLKASAGARVRGLINGVAAEVPLAETTSLALSPSERERVLGDAVASGAKIVGLYYGELRLPQSVTAAPQPVTYTVTARDGSIATAVSEGTVSIASVSSRSVGLVILADRTHDIDARPYGIVESAPDGGWLFYPPAGTPFAITGSDGAYYRVALGSVDQGWISKDSLALAPAGTPAPAAQVEDVIVRDEPRSTTIVVHLTGRVPFRVDEAVDDPSLRVRIYGAAAATNFIRYGSDRSAVRSILSDQLSGGLAAVDVKLRQRALWGYFVDWDGNDIKLVVKKPPHFLRPPAPALRGLVVVVDPGHSPDAGAIGPLGTQERDVNLAIAKRLAVHLEQLGARAVLTREANVPVGLYDRTELAARLRADVLVSVHNNALPDGANPFTHHGFSVYYYQPQSLELARAIHLAYARDTDLVDYGLYYDNLALARPTEEPAVLTESAFIMWPPEEMLLRSALFQDKLGFTIADGIERWAESMRRLETAGI